MSEIDVIKDELLSLTVTTKVDVPTIVNNMIVYDGDKHEVILSEDDKKELATLFMVKGGMSGLSKRAKDMEEKAKEVGSPWMLARGVKTVKVPGVGTFSVTEGQSVSISQDSLRKVLVNYVDADKVQEILEKVVKKTPYVTLQFREG